MVSGRSADTVVIVYVVRFNVIEMVKFYFLKYWIKKRRTVREVRWERREGGRETV